MGRRGAEVKVVWKTLYAARLPGRECSTALRVHETTATHRVKSTGNSGGRPVPVQPPIDRLIRVSLEAVTVRPLTVRQVVETAIKQVVNPLLGYR